MSTQFALDLRLARRTAGYTQRDCAHLLMVHQSKVSALERGLEMPTLVQICTLSQIYGRSFESLFAEVMKEACASLRRQITTLPKDTRAYIGTRNREHSLEKLAERLAAEEATHV